MSLAYVTPLRPVATLDIDGVALPVEGGTVTLDENYSPYVQASITIPIDSPDIAESIDPRTPQRLTLTVADETFDFLEPRVFDLGIRDRTVDHKEQTLTIEATSDEAKLHDTCRLGTTTDRTARAYETTLRGIVDWAIGKVGGALEPGSPDYDMTATWDQTNLIHDPRFTLPTSTWSAFRGSSGEPATKTAAAGLTLEGAAVGWVLDSIVAATTAEIVGIGAGSAGVSNVTPGRLYTLSGYLSQNSGVAKTGRLRIHFYGADSVVLAQATITKSLPSGTYTKVAVTGVAPEGVEAVDVTFAVTNGMPASSRVSLAVPVLAEGTQNDRWFDKDRPDDALYVYDGVAGGPSTRIALNPRSPELYDWDPGQSLFDFLRPFLEVSGLRLYCDEQRQWWLTPPALTDTNNQVEAYATGAGGYDDIGNALAGTDVISRDRGDWATGIVIRYIWRTANGDRKTQYDAAGTDEKVILIDREVAYPGPGAAATILAAMSKRGRTQSATIARGYEASPGSYSRVALPGTAVQEGRVRRVVIDLETGNADIATNGTT